jgi:putative protease
VVSRNRDHQWESALTKKSSERKVAVELLLSEIEGGLRLTVTDEDGIASSADAAIALQPAQQAEQAEAGLRTSLGKLGNTMFEARGVALQLSQPWFVPSSSINALRRDAIAAHEAAWPAGSGPGAPRPPSRPPSIRKPSSATWPTSTTRRHAPSTTSTGSG